MGTRPEKCCLQNSNANSHVAQVMSDQRDVTCNITRDLISDPLVEKTDPIWNVSHIFDDFASCFRRKFQTKVTRFVPECPAPHRAGMDQSWCSVPAGVNGRNRFLTLSDLDLSKWMQIFCQTKKLRSKTVAFWVQNTRSDESTRDKKNILSVSEGIVRPFGSALSSRRDCKVLCNALESRGRGRNLYSIVKRGKRAPTLLHHLQAGFFHQTQDECFLPSGPPHDKTQKIFHLK